jgi:hypothetical protein
MAYEIKVHLRDENFMFSQNSEYFDLNSLSNLEINCHYEIKHILYIESIF